MSEDKTTCSLHEIYDSWLKDRFIEQEKKNILLSESIQDLNKEIVQIKLFMAKVSVGLGISIALTQFLAPVIWKMLGVK